MKGKDFHDINAVKMPSKRMENEEGWDNTSSSENEEM
jgi:hypothetical protein